MVRARKQHWPSATLYLALGTVAAVHSTRVCCPVEARVWRCCSEQLPYLKYLGAAAPAPWVQTSGPAELQLRCMQGVR